MMKISKLLDGYEGPLPDFQEGEPPSAEKIIRLTREKIRGLPADERRPGRRRFSRAVLIAAAAAVVLTVCALAAGDLRFGEIPEPIRILLGIRDASVPETLRYDTVNFAPNARTSDVHRVGEGELYVTEVTSDAVRSENLLVVYVSAAAVTPEQFERYVWRVRLEGSDEWVVAEPDAGRGGPVYYEDGISGGRVFLRIAFVLDSEERDLLRATLYGGTQSEDGRVFNVERIGIFTAFSGTPSELVTVAFGEGIPFANIETGETGLITQADVSADRMIWYWRADRLFELYEITYGSGRGTLSAEDWRAKNTELMGWPSGMARRIFDASLNFSDGTSRGGLIGGAGRYLEDDSVMEVCWWGPHRGPVDMALLESVTVAGVTYPVG